MLNSQENVTLHLKIVYFQLLYVSKNLASRLKILPPECESLINIVKNYLLQWAESCCDFSSHYEVAEAGVNRKPFACFFFRRTVFFSFLKDRFRNVLFWLSWFKNSELFLVKYSFGTNGMFLMDGFKISGWAGQTVWVSKCRTLVDKLFKVVWTNIHPCAQVVKPILS